MSTEELLAELNEMTLELSADVHQIVTVVQTFLVIIGILLACLIVRWMWRRIFKFALSFIKF